MVMIVCVLFDNVVNFVSGTRVARKEERHEGTKRWSPCAPPILRSFTPWFVHAGRIPQDSGRGKGRWVGWRIRAVIGGGWGKLAENFREGAQTP